MSERAYSPLIAGIEEIRRIAKPSSKPKSTNSTPSCRPCRTKLQRLRVTSRLPSLLARSTYARSTKSPWQSRTFARQSIEGGGESGEMTLFRFSRLRRFGFGPLG